MKTESFKEKMGDWFPFWEPFILSEEMDKIYAKLKADSILKDMSTGNKIRIFPDSKDTFNAFKYCKPENLKVIIYAQDPYVGEYFDTKLPQADGLCLSNSNSQKKVQPSLKYFLNGIAKEYEIKINAEDNLDLKYLAEQGVLLLNRALTVKKGQIGSHGALWDEFHKYFLERIQSEFPGVPILFLGKDAAVLKKYVFEMANPMLFLSHPSAAAQAEEDWDTKGFFSRINIILRSNFNIAIKWFKHQWDEIQDDLHSEDENTVKLAKLKDEKEGLPF